MTATKKAALPALVDHQGKTAFQNQDQNTMFSLKYQTRRQLKQFVVCLACRGIISTSWAGWIIGKMGVVND